jgi:hypothetical protein
MWLMAKIPVLFRRGQAQEYFLECCPWCGMVPAVSEMRKMFQQSALALCAAVCAAPALHAERFVVDFPTSGIDAPPGGLLAGPVMEWEDPGGRRIDVPLAPTADSQRLVATIVFEEAPGDAIRIWWEPDVPGSPVPIAGEWTDGIRGWNQKSGLIPAELSEQGGNLVFESAGSSRRIHRLILTRLDRGEWFVPEGLAGLEFFRIEGETVGSDDLQGRAWSMPPDAWNGNVIEAHLQEFTESTQGGVEFLVEIRPAPQQAVLRFEMSAADLLAPQVWVNGKPLPNVSMEIPPLRGTHHGSGPIQCRSAFSGLARGLGACTCGDFAPRGESIPDQLGLRRGVRAPRPRGDVVFRPRSSRRRTPRGFSRCFFRGPRYPAVAGCPAGCHRARPAAMGRREWSGAGNHPGCARLVSHLSKVKLDPTL